jgi:hypothetical protein
MLGGCLVLTQWISLFSTFLVMTSYLFIEAESRLKGDFKSKLYSSETNLKMKRHDFNSSQTLRVTSTADRPPTFATSDDLLCLPLAHHEPPRCVRVAHAAIATATASFFGSHVNSSTSLLLHWVSINISLIFAYGDPKIHL